MTVVSAARSVGVVMAGGSGERMRASGESTQKPLVTVLGVPLVERSLFAMLKAGLTDIRLVVAADARGEQVACWAGNRGQVLVAAAGGRMSVVRESQPLGNCGGLVLAMGDDDRDALLVFADNLTDIALTVLIGAHEEHQAALTLAVHSEPFRLPYGIVDVVAGTVMGYREKPALEVTVSSGLAVVSASARELLSGRAGLADLANAVVARGLVAQPYQHRCRWIDVNDISKVELATRMIQSAPDRFERCWPAGTNGVTESLGDVDVSTEVGPGSAPASTRPILIDDVSTAGTPVRIDVAQARPDQLGPEGWARVLAWREIACR